MTQNLGGQNVHQETDAQTVDLNSGLWQGKNTEMDSGKEVVWRHPAPAHLENILIITKNPAFYNALICSHFYLRFTTFDIKKLYISYLLPVTLPITGNFLKRSTDRTSLGGRCISCVQYLVNTHKTWTPSMKKNKS